MRILLTTLLLFWLSCQQVFEPAQRQEVEKKTNSKPIEQLSFQEVLDLPMASKKTLLAHFMTGDIDYDFGARPGGLSRSHSWYSPAGEFTQLGGVNQVAPMDMFLFKRGERSLEQVVTQELRAAHVAGLEAFHFYYPEVNNAAFMSNYNQVIASFFRVGAKLYPNFKFTLCLSNANEGLEAEKLERWSKAIKSLVRSVESYDSWLKTPDGRVIFYLWNNDALADVMEHKPWLIDRYPERIQAVAQAHRKLAEKIGLRAAFMYDLRFPANHRLTEKVLDHFSGVWSWTDNTKHMKEFRQIASLCRVRKRDFCLTVYPDYYTSKLYWKDRSKGHGMIHYRDLKKVDKSMVERHYQNCGLSSLYRQLFEFAVEADLRWISLATWNDFPEGHHIAPELNHNFAPMVLMEYYRNKWMGKGGVLKESLSVFYKKYKHDKKPQHEIGIYTKESMGSPNLEDYIEVVSVLNEAGNIFINGKYAGRVGKGLQTVKIPSEPGEVVVELKRKGKVVKILSPPVKITDKPYRTDRLTYMYSTRFNEYFKKIFGNEKSIPKLLD